MIQRIANIFFNLLFFLCLPVIINAAITLPSIPVTQFIITSYGASSSSTDNSTAINAAIVAANNAGGGTVVIPADTFYSGPITMMSNVNLYLSSGSVLIMLPYGKGNGSPAGSYPNNGNTDQYTPFIYGKGLNNIAVTGTGTIEGQGSAWWTAYNANNNMKRPYLIRFAACNNVLVDSITLKNSPNVHVCLGQSSSMGSNGTISNINVYAPSNSPNTDAIDTWYWNGINITHCHLSEGDDNVAMDSYSTNVNITDCTFGNGHGVSVGSYALGVENINVDSCSFDSTTNGIRLKSERGRGSADSSFTYSNITMNNVKYPIYITSFYPTEPYPASDQKAQTITSTTPSWNKIYFKNITITNSTYGGIIYGLPEMPVNNLVFDNVQLSASSGLVTNFVKGLVFNCSNITVPSSNGNAIVPFSATINGIDTISGVSTTCSDSAIMFKSGSTVESVPQGTAITNIVYKYGGMATGAIAVGLPTGVIANVDSIAQTITLSGTPSTIGIYNYTIVAMDSTVNLATISGKIIVAAPTAKKLAYITYPNNAADTLILNKLESNQDFALTLENADVANNYSNFDLIILGPVPPSGIGGLLNLRGYNKPELVLEPFVLKGGDWGWGTAVNTSTNSVIVSDTSKGIFSNLTFIGANNDQLQLYNTVTGNGVTGIVSTSWLGSPKVDPLALAYGTLSTQSIVEIPIGTNMNGTKTKQRFLLIGLSKSSSADLTSNATQLIENACNYLLSDTSTTSNAKLISKNNDIFKLIQTNNSIEIITKNNIKGLELYNLSGEKISVNCGNTISISNLVQGVYLVRIIGQNENSVIKFFKQ